MTDKRSSYKVHLNGDELSSSELLQRGKSEQTFSHIDFFNDQPSRIVSEYENLSISENMNHQLNPNHSTHMTETQIDTSRLMDAKKLNAIQEQQREIQKVAEQLIHLKTVINKLKSSLGVAGEDATMGGLFEDSLDANNGLMVGQQEFTAEDIWNGNGTINNDTVSTSMQQTLLRRLQLTAADRRITPEYKEWILQYLKKITNDLKQIKTQFENYEKAKRKNENNLDLSDSKVSFGQNEKPYQNLIEYQIKCRLLECVLRLCKAKGIFNTVQFMKRMQKFEIVSNDILIENLYKYKMSNIVQKLRALKKVSPEESFYQWKTIHDELQIVNLQQIQRFYKEKKQLSYLNSYQNNENGILIIGGSGVGKTTLFLSMAGEKMIKKKIKSRNNEYENYQAADQEIANQYKTSPFSTSCTREPAKLQAPKKYTFPEELCLIDTAGFQDSRSGQIDIMNTLYTYETIQEMKKLRIVIVISEKSIGERESGLSRFAKSIGRYFRDYEEVRESILFVLTKFENIKRLKIACENLLKVVGQKESNEYQFVKHLQESIVYKECVEFRPTDEQTVFEGEFHIDAVEMDGKLKKLYKSLLKKFPIHHEYENDYINLEYSRETKDKLAQKKCYLENMIRKLYQEGDNNFRYYLEQLMFLENKINKIDYGNHNGNRNGGPGSPKRHHGHHHQNDRKDPQPTFDILSFIEEINHEVLSRFSETLDSYFEDGDAEKLRVILELKRRYSNLYLGSVDEMVENSEVIEEDYQYVFQEIAESINSLKADFEKIVDEKQKVITKTLKFKPKWCHDISNKVWLTAVINFTSQYYSVDSDQGLSEKGEQQEQQAADRNSSKESSHDNAQEGGRPLGSPLASQNREFKALVKALRKNEQKFRQEFGEESLVMDQEIANYLSKKANEPHLPSDFLVETQREIIELYSGFKKLVFHDQIIVASPHQSHPHSPGVSLQPITQSPHSHHSNTSISGQPQSVIILPSDESIRQSNLNYIVEVLKSNFDKEYEDICQNIELMNLVNHSLKDSDSDISRSVFMEVERYSEKVKIYFSCDKQVYDLMQSFYAKVMKKVSVIVSEINGVLEATCRRQQKQKYGISSSEGQWMATGQVNRKAAAGAGGYKAGFVETERLNDNLLYCYLSKINEIQEFEELRKEMEFLVKSFNVKLLEYCGNLQECLQANDKRLASFKKVIRKEKQSGKTLISLAVHNGIRDIVEECVRIEHQTKLIYHYFRNFKKEESVLEKIPRYGHLVYMQSISYRHGRFVESEKRSIHESYKLGDSLKVNNLPLELIVDYVILEEAYSQKSKYDDTFEFRKLHKAYENSHQEMKNESEFEDMKNHELKMLNECKQRILDKLIDHPYQTENENFHAIEDEDFQTNFESEPIKKTIQIFLYYVKLKEYFEEIESLNNEEGVVDFRLVEFSEMISPVQMIEENIDNLTGLLVTIAEIADYKYLDLKEALEQIVLDGQTQRQIANYLKGCDLLCRLFRTLESTCLEKIGCLEELLENLQKKSLFHEIREFIDKCESIFYRVSKNIDSIELEHLENISEVLDKPQSTTEFLKVLKTQCLFFEEILEEIDPTAMTTEIVRNLKELLRKMEESESQMDFKWEEEMKELEKEGREPKNSLHKLIKLYEQQIGRVSTQKTSEYRFVELKKEELAAEIKSYLKEDNKKVEAGQQLCEQLKNYLQFLKSIRFKMVVNVNDMDEIKDIEQLERLYEKGATRSQYGRSQTDLTPSEVQLKILDIDHFEHSEAGSDKESEVVTSQFAPNYQRNSKPHHSRNGSSSALRRSRNNFAAEDLRRSGRGEKRLPSNQEMDQSFSNIADSWTKEMAISSGLKQKKNSEEYVYPRGGPRKTEHFRTDSNSNDMTKSNIDHLKKYTINPGAGTSAMKKSAINLKQSPPEMKYDITPARELEGGQTQNSHQLIPSESNKSLKVNPMKYSRTIPKVATEKEIIY